MRRRLPVLSAVAALAIALTACSSTTGSGSSSGGKSVAPSSLHFLNVVKLTSSTWFSRMGTGVKKFSQQTGIDVRETGPAQATAEGQVSIIQTAIPQKPDVIGVVPNDPASLEGVLGRAQKAGIVVVSEEASQMKNTDFDLEAFSNNDYGATMMDSLATCMGHKGQYAAFVGHLTAASHMEWVASALQRAKSRYPAIKRVTGPVVANEDANVAYQKTKELLAKYPNLKGFEGSAATDVVGIAKAVTELGLAHKVCIVGTSVPSLVKQDLKNGTIYKIFLWDPGLAGDATMHAAQMLAEHKKVGPGTDLKVPGYTSIQPCGGQASSHCYRGNAELQVDKSNLTKYNF